MILMTFFLVGILDIMYDWNVLGNLVTKIILFGALFGFAAYIAKINVDKHKKNPSQDETGSSH